MVNESAALSSSRNALDDSRGDSGENDGKEVSDLSEAAMDEPELDGQVSFLRRGPERWLRLVVDDAADCCETERSRGAAAGAVDEPIAAGRLLTLFLLDKRGGGGKRRELFVFVFGWRVDVDDSNGDPDRGVGLREGCVRKQAVYRKSVTSGVAEVNVDVVVGGIMKSHCSKATTTSGPSQASTVSVERQGPVKLWARRLGLRLGDAGASDWTPSAKWMHLPMGLCGGSVGRPRGPEPISAALEPALPRHVDPASLRLADWLPGERRQDSGNNGGPPIQAAGFDHASFAASPVAFAGSSKNSKSWRVGSETEGLGNVYFCIVGFEFHIISILSLFFLLLFSSNRLSPVFFFFFPSY